MNNQIVIDNIEKQIKHLEEKTSVQQKLKIIEKLCKKGKIGEHCLLEYLIYRRIKTKQKILLLDGLIFEKLYHTEYQDILTKLKQNFKQGVLQLDNDLTLNYQPLQELLVNQNFQEADELTQKYLCKLAGLGKEINREWLYFTDIAMIPAKDLLYIDLLWQLYSRGKFGFSIQRQIWINNRCKWNTFWQIIGWTKQSIPCRYPLEFIWTLEAPKGHLPLFNQLRGIQVISALFDHIVWQETNIL